MSNDSLGGSIAGAMAQAAAGAMVGRAIGDARNAAEEAQDRADFATNKANEWYDYAKRLERQIDLLQANLRLEKSKRELANLDLQAAQAKHIKDIEQWKKSLDEERDLSNFMSDNRNRLQKRVKIIQVAMKQSTAAHESSKLVIQSLMEVIENAGLASSIPADLYEKSEAIKTAVLSGDALAIEPTIKSIVDQAPPEFLAY